MKRTSVNGLFAIMVLAFFGATLADQPHLTIDPGILTVEIGTDNEVQCTFPEGKTGSLTWLFENNDTLVETSNQSRIYFEPETGTLYLTEAELNDTGNYICVANLTECLGGGEIGINGTWSDLGTDCLYNASLAYKVYIMPDYTTDGIVIGVINGVLLIIFLVCVIRTAINDKIRLKKYGQKL